LTDPADDLIAIQRKKGKRVDGTSEWLLKREEYRAWRDGHNLQLLLLIGDPGIGKTMISSFLVEELKTFAMTLAYYFCDNKEEKRNTATSILRGLLLQLLKQRRILFKHIKADYKLQEKSLFENLDALWRILLNMLKDPNAGKIYVLVDALDECERSSRQAFLALLGELGDRMDVKFLITCRPDLKIERALHDVGTCLRIDSAKINSDLSKFIDVKR